MKLIDLLVKKTAEEGWEWPEGAVEAEVFTYEGGLVNFWTEEGHALAHGAHAFKARGLDLCEIESVSRAQYEAALAASDDRLEQDLNECIGQDFDVVNHPPHYTQGGIECIDAIKAALGEEQYEGYLRGACIKYLWRYKMKSGVESLKKSEWYLKRLIELNEEIESRNK